MGEETELMAAEDVVAAEGVTADEPCRDYRRKRKKHLYKSLLKLMEFYLGDVNLSKNRFISQLIHSRPFVYVDLAIFLTFNKVKALTSNIEDLAKALSHSETLQVSEDGTQVCRKTPIKKKTNEDDCTIYVEQLGPDVDHDLLIKVFSEFGPVDYVSLPRFAHNNKFKGFAFVEFESPEYAKKALETLNAKGCCLSPHMAPEELISVKTFESNKENKNEESGKSGKNIENENNEQSSSHMKEQPFIEEVNDGTSSTDMGIGTQSTKTNDVHNKANLKRKSTDGVKSVKSKKHKSEDKDVQCTNVIETNKTEASEALDREKAKEETKILTSSSSTDELINKNENTSDSETLKPHIETKEELIESGKTTIEKKKKRGKNVDEMINQASTSNTEKGLDEESEPLKKKIKLDTEGLKESEISPTEEEPEDDTKQRKKRKRKKSLKKDKTSATSLDLKVLSKREWKQLRNKYLNMQREMMGSLKHYLSCFKNKPISSEQEEQNVKQEESLKPGTVIRITLNEPVTNATTAKSEMRIHPDIRYIDVKEGSPCVYLRTFTSEVAATLIQSKCWPSMEILQGEEEKEYWNKMRKDREDYMNKNKPPQRGRTKLLKRAEKFQGKHMTSLETS